MKHCKREIYNDQWKTQVTWQLMWCWDGGFNEINVMKSILRGNFITKYKYKDTSTIFSFSIGNKIPPAMRKSLRTALPFTKFTCDLWHFISRWNRKKMYFNSKLQGQRHNVHTSNVFLILSSPKVSSVILFPPPLATSVTLFFRHTTVGLGVPWVIHSSFPGFPDQAYTDRCRSGSNWGLSAKIQNW